ncbi:MAG: DUF2201 family putative metallopeptidase [Gemmatimonadales bacterium]
MRVWRSIATAMVVGLCAAETAAAQASRLPGVRLVPTPTLADAAIAIADGRQRVIYFNPRVLEEVGPDLAAFLLAHEEGHIALGHSRSSVANLGHEDAERLLNAYERDADCYAARLLATHHRSAALSAVTWFRARGTWRPDREHPIGFERATVIESCLAAADWARGGAVGR